MFKHIMDHFYRSGKYEIAEHASYGKITDLRAHTVPWKFYANSPNDDNDPRNKEYNHKETNKFGEWRFDKVVLDFRPDIVIGLKDVYMDAHIINSPLAKYYHSILAPPIDSHPQKDEFNYVYSRADAIFAHTKYGARVLQEELPAAKLKGIMGFGVDTNCYYPRNKAVLRKKWGIPESAIVFGSVMRNQRRKLFPNLMAAFSQFLKESGKPFDQQSYLYLHTAYPEREGWNFPKIIKELGIGNRLLVNYLCKTCGNAFASVYQDARTICPECNNCSAVMPTVYYGYTKEQMAEVYNMMDLYFQVSTCEGAGIPPIEAAACGVPVASMDFGPMAEVIDNIGGQKIALSCVQRDLENDSFRAFPKNHEITNIMHDFCHDLVDSSKFYDPTVQIAAVKKHYSFDDVSQKLMDYVESVERPGRWDEDFYTWDIPQTIPEGLSDAEFVDFLYYDVMNTPQERNEYFAKSMERDLFYGVAILDGKVKELSRKKVHRYCVSQAKRRQELELVRTGNAELRQEDFLQFANRNKK